MFEFTRQTIINSLTDPFTNEQRIAWVTNGSKQILRVLKIMDYDPAKIVDGEGTAKGYYIAKGYNPTISKVTFPIPTGQGQYRIALMVAQKENNNPYFDNSYPVPFIPMAIDYTVATGDSAATFT
jgi:hypothetical protein